MFQENLSSPFALDFPKTPYNQLKFRTQSMAFILEKKSKSPKFQEKVTCRICSNSIEYGEFKEHSQACKKLVEKHYLINVLKQNAITYFSNLKAIERKLSQHLFLERF